MMGSDQNLNAKAENELPHPQDHPQAAVVIFDGNCRFCRAQISRLRRLDTRGRLSFISLHDPMVAQHFPDLSHDRLMQQMYVVDQRQRRYGGAAAVRYFTRALPRLWWAAPFLHLPGTLPLWQRLYRAIARRRYQLSDAAACSDQACEIHFHG